MNHSDIFIFTLHQFIILVLCLILIFYAWRDQVAKTYEYLKNVQMKIIVPLFLGLFIGLNFFFISEWRGLGIVLSFSYSLLIILSIFDPKYAASFFVFLLISRPWEMFQDQVINNFPKDIFWLCFLSLVSHKIMRRKFYFQWNMTTVCVVAFALWTFFSLIPSVQIVSGMISYFDVFIKGTIVYLLIVNIVETQASIGPVQAALVLGITEKCLVSFYNSVILGKVGIDGRLMSVGILENSNDIAALIVLVIPFALSFLKEFTNLLFKYIVGFFIFSFYFYLIWQAKSRGAILGVGALIASSLWLKIKNKKAANIILLIGFCLSIGSLSMIKRESSDVDESTSNRSLFWIAGINMGIRNPLFGVGYEGFQNSLLGYAKGNVGTEGANKTVHSTWLLAFAETGVIGFLLYIGIWFFSFRSAWPIRAAHPEYLIAILSYGTVVTFLSHTYLLFPYILMGLTVAAGASNKRVIERF